MHASSEIRTRLHRFGTLQDSESLRTDKCTRYNTKTLRSLPLTNIKRNKITAQFPITSQLTDDQMFCTTSKSLCQFNTPHKRVFSLRKKYITNPRHFICLQHSYVLSHLRFNRSSEASNHEDYPHDDSNQ
jgi:hypothetical protein